MRARYLTPARGLWISRDPLGLVLPSEPNVYWYASSSPIRLIDPSGQAPIKDRYGPELIAGDLPPHTTAREVCKEPVLRGEGEANAVTSCNRKTGKRFTVVCYHNPCWISCLREHEGVHRNQGTVCCAGYSACIYVAKISIRTCHAQYGAFVQANRAKDECEAHRRGVQCAVNALKSLPKSCPDDPCKAPLESFLKTQRFNMNYYCNKKGGASARPVPCPFDAKGNIVKPL